MAKYNIEIKKSALKEIKKLTTKEIKKILKKIESLSHTPRPFDCKRLSAQEIYRIRCGDHRILYSIEDDKLIIFIIKIGHRKDVYKKL